MTKERAVEVIEDLRDYAYENWDDLEYREQLDEIGEAVDFVKNYIVSSTICGTAEIGGKKYLITEVEHNE